MAPAASTARRRPGFTIPGYAAAAARKGHELGLCRQWTADEARRHGIEAAAKRTKEERRAAQ